MLLFDNVHFDYMKFFLEFKLLYSNYDSSYLFFKISFLTSFNLRIKSNYSPSYGLKPYLQIDLH